MSQPPPNDWQVINVLKLYWSHIFMSCLSFHVLLIYNIELEVVLKRSIGAVDRHVLPVISCYT